MINCCIGALQKVFHTAVFLFPRAMSQADMAGLIKNKKGGTAYEMDYGFGTNEKH